MVVVLTTHSGLDELAVVTCVMALRAPQRFLADGLLGEWNRESLAEGACEWAMRWMIISRFASNDEFFDF